MKKFNLFFLVLICAATQAQGSKTYTVKPGENIYVVIPAKDIYRYPNFVQGTVIFRDGRTAGSKLNFNALVGAIQFIDSKGDTLSLAEEQTIKYVVMDKDSFCYDRGYIELLAQNASVRLGKIEYFKDFEQKEGTYGMASNTSSTINASSIIDKRAFNFNTDRELLVVKKVQYFFGNTNEFLPAEKKNVLKLFPKRKKEIADYLENAPISFNREDDLFRLAAFLKTL